MTAVGVEGDGVTFRMTRWHLRITTPYYVMRDPVLRHAGPTLRHTRPRSGIQVSVANVFILGLLAPLWRAVQSSKCR